MINQMKLASLLLTLCFFSQGHASNENINWAAIRTEGQIVTANEVREYTDHMLVTENLQAALFKAADQDYEKFQLNRDKIINDSFSPALKRMAFIRLAQAIATKVTDRSFFRLTKDEFKKLKAAAGKELFPKLETAIKNLVDNLFNPKTKSSAYESC